MSLAIPHSLLKVLIMLLRLHICLILIVFPYGQVLCFFVSLPLYKKGLVALTFFSGVSQAQMHKHKKLLSVGVYTFQVQHDESGFGQEMLLSLSGS